MIGSVFLFCFVVKMRHPAQGAAGGWVMLELVFRWFPLCEFSLFDTPQGQFSGSLGSWSQCSHSKGSGLDLWLSPSGLSREGARFKGISANFAYAIRQWSSFIFDVAVQFSRCYQLKRLSFPLYILASFVINSSFFLWIYFWDIYCVPLSYASVSMLIPYCFSYYSFEIQFEIRAYNAFSFYLNIALVIQGILWFHTNFRILLYLKNATGNLIGIALNLD